MRRYALPLLFLVSCASAQGAGERVDDATSAFTSAHANLLDFELDGTLVASTNDPAALRTQIEAQLLFTTGQLNGEESVAQLGQVELSAINATLIAPPPPPAPAPPPSYAVKYHAKLPVAWGATSTPASYSFILPASLSEAGQLAFVTKYGVTCVDPAAGSVAAGTMFLFYRPRQPGCTLAAADVATFAATVTTSTQNTHGKYPEYQRVWADAAFEVVAMFSHEYETPTLGDAGVRAYDDFVWSVHQYLGELQPDDAKRTEPAGVSPSGMGASSVRLAAQLRDGRTIAVNVRLVGHALTDDGAAFDSWYDAVSPKADVILYNGHAGLGENVRTLMTKGSFESGQYVIWFANGCDTFAYVDRTLVDRRALLNPDDPGGTKYMDTVTNVMAGYFGALAPTSLTLIQAIVDARDATRPPKTYEQMFQTIDPTQIVVVTGEEDNVLEPLPQAPGAEGEASTAGVTQGLPLGAEAQGEASSTSPPGAGQGACSVGRGRHAASSGLVALGLALSLLGLRRRGHPSRARERSVARRMHPAWPPRTVKSWPGQAHSRCCCSCWCSCSARRQQSRSPGPKASRSRAFWSSPRPSCSRRSSRARSRSPRRGTGPSSCAWGGFTGSAGPGCSSSSR
jgi:hypothetical protein